METTNTGILVGSVGNSVYIRIVGRGSFQNSAMLRQLGQELLARNVSSIFIDLAECPHMDSTFLGTLTGMGTRFRKQRKNERIRLTNVNPRNLDLLENLGVALLFDLNTLPLQQKPDQLQQLPDSQASDRLTQAETALEAHEQLVNADSRNLAKFQDVIEFLKDDVKKLQGNGKK